MRSTCAARHGRNAGRAASSAITTAAPAAAQTAPDSRLEVHHLTYERAGHERLEDLQTLCHLCHCREHGRAPQAGLLPIAGPSRDELTRRAALQNQQRRTLTLADLRTRPLHERLAVLGAAQGRVDLSAELRVIQRRIVELEGRMTSGPERDTLGGASTTRSNTGAAKGNQPSFRVGDLHSRCKSLETAYAAGQLDPGPHFDAIERRVAAAERKLRRS